MSRVARTRVTARTLPIALPVKGVDQSLPFGQGDPLTARTARNVRSIGGFNDRLGITKRYGLRRAFTDQMSNSADTRIIGLKCLNDAVATPSVPAQTTYLRPTGLVSNGAGAVIGGTTPAATIYESIDDTPVPDDDVTYVAIACSPVAGTELDFVVDLTNAAPSPAQIVIRFRIKIFLEPTTNPNDPGAASNDPSVVITGEDGGINDTASPTSATDGDGQIRLDLLETSTLRATTGYVTPSSVGVWETVSYSLSSSEIAAIGTYNNLRLRVRVSSGLRGFYVTDAHVQIETGSLTGELSDNLVLALLDDKAYVGDLDADTIVAVDQTDPATNSSTGLTRAFPSIAIHSDRWWAVDGNASKRITPGTVPIVANWTASAGTLPAGCQLVCTYRGRVVLARQAATPALWYMSKTGNAEDWDFVGDTDEPPPTLAVAGTNTLAGQPADAIVALIPANDDYLYFGCESSFWVMVGDPGFGGTVNPLSQQTGILGSRAFVFDEHGHLWFMGTGGLYRIQRGTMQIEPINSFRLFKLLTRVDPETTLVQMSWDGARKEVLIHFTRLSNATDNDNNLHVAYDTVNDAFWIDRYLDESPILGPWAVCQIGGSNYQDRRWLMGTDHGYIERPDDSALADDVTRSDVLYATGFKIRCICDWQPFEFDPELQTTALELSAWGQGTSQTIGGDTNLPLGEVPWRWYTADDAASVAQKAVNLSAANGTWFIDSDGGFQTPGVMRTTGGAHRLRIEENSSNKSWAIGRLAVKMARAGRRR